MKIAVIRGDFASEWELQNFKSLSRSHELTLFTGLRPVSRLSGLDWLEIILLPSPVDLNIQGMTKYSMAISNRLFSDAHVLFGLERKLKGFDIAHCAETYFYFTQQCIRAKLIGNVKRVVSTVWENIPFNNEGIHGRKNFKKNSFKEIDHFLPVTQAASQALLKEGCDPQKTTVLNPGVDINRFRPMSATNKNIRILVVSRLVPEKGILKIVNIFHEIKKKHNNIELVIAGSGPLKPKDSTLLGQISYESMPSVYTSCNVFVHYPVGSNTWTEQYGMVLIEAMSCGLPVISLDRGSTKEVVGNGGLAVSEKDFPAALEKLIINKEYRITLGQKARQFASLHYDANLYSEKIEQIYEKVLHDKK